MFHFAKSSGLKIVLTLLLNSFTLLAYDIEVRVPTLDQHYVTIIQELWKKCPSSMKIEVIKNSTFWEKITGKSISKISLTSSLLDKVPWKLSTFFLSGSVCSYCAIAYFFYRVYCVVTKINTFLSWWNGNSQETTLIEDVERMFVRTVKEENFNSKTELFNEECLILEAYLYIEKRLSLLHIRWMFPYSNDLEIYKIKEMLTALKTISDYSRNHSYSTTRMILPNEKESATLT